MALRNVVLAALVLVLCASAAASAGHGSAYVTTLPPGATVWIDGHYMGETPLVVDGLTLGHHSVLLTHAGWTPVTTAVDVTVGQIAFVSAMLTPSAQSFANAAKGMLRIRDAQGAKVFVDGIAVTSLDNPVPLAPGQHIISVERGAARTASSVRIYPATTTVLSLAPEVPDQSQAATGQDELAALTDYVPASDFVVNGDDITVHFKAMELECAVGSLDYVLNGKPGTLTVAPEMVGDKPYLPVSLLARLTGAH
jgi:hypothetical protein